MAQILEIIHIIHTNMLSSAMQAHYSAASRLAYITQSNKNLVHVGLATKCLTNVYRLCRYKRITAVTVTQNIRYDSNSNIFNNNNNVKKKKTIRASQI